MVIAEMFQSPNMDTKVLKSVVKPAEGLMQSTKAATSIILELHYSLRSKTKLHAVFTTSGLSIAECMKADEIEGEPSERLEALNVKMGYLLEPLVVIDWRLAETGTIDLLKEHDFSAETEEEPDFTKEFNFLESQVPEGPDGRLSRNFTRVVVTAVMTYAVGEKNNLVNRIERMEDGTKETNLSDCEIYLESIWTAVTHSWRRYLFSPKFLIDMIIMLHS